MSLPTRSPVSRRRRKQEYRSRSAERERFTREIAAGGVLQEVFCDDCIHFGVVCLAMPEGSKSRSSKCLECFRNNRPCSSKSWPVLDRTREVYGQRVADDRKRRDALFSELAELTARLNRNEKILAQAEADAKEKFWCLARHLDENGEEVYAVGRSSTDFSNADFVDPEVLDFSEVPSLSQIDRLLSATNET